MARTLFFRMVLSKLSEITDKKQIFSQCNIFYNYGYFFSLRFGLFWFYGPYFNTLLFAVSMYTWKKLKSHTKIKDLEYQLRHRMISLNYMMDHILF